MDKMGVSFNQLRKHLYFFRKIKKPASILKAGLYLMLKVVLQEDFLKASSIIDKCSYQSEFCT